MPSVNEPLSLTQLALCLYVRVDAHVDHGLSLSYFCGLMITSPWRNPSEFIIFAGAPRVRHGDRRSRRLGGGAYGIGDFTVCSAGIYLRRDGCAHRLGVAVFDTILFAAGFVY